MFWANNLDYLFVLLLANIDFSFNMVKVLKVGVFWKKLLVNVMHLG